MYFDIRNVFVDNLFGPESRNYEIFGAIVKPIVELAMDGYNGTIFAYGQTSSGKLFFCLLRYCSIVNGKYFH